VQVVPLPRKASEQAVVVVTAHRPLDAQHAPSGSGHGSGTQTAPGVKTAPAGHAAASVVVQTALGSQHEPMELLFVTIRVYGPPDGAEPQDEILMR